MGNQKSTLRNVSYEKENGSLYRFCCKEEIRDFLRNGITQSINCDFVSLTDNPNAEGFDKTDDKWNYRVTYDADKILSQGGFKIQYTPEFFKLNPIILEHVGGIKIDDILSEGYRDLEHYIYTVIDKAEVERETLVKYLEMEKGLVTGIERYDIETGWWIPII